MQTEQISLTPVKPEANVWFENCFDLARGFAAYTGSGLISGLAQVIAKHPESCIANAFNHKQVGSKVWARDAIFDTLGGKFDRIVVLGGWYGVLAGFMLDDKRFTIGMIDNVDIDEDVPEIARTLNAAFKENFRPVTADMYALDYASYNADLIINTSCEHIPDLKLWLDKLPRGSRVLLQSNDYFTEPTHINCVPNLEAFKAQVNLSEVLFEGELKMKKYKRFMLIGTV